jgi:hypothetical protein
MGRAERAVEVSAVVPAPFELDQPLLQADQELTCLLEKHRPEAIVSRQARLPVLT